MSEKPALSQEEVEGVLSGNTPPAVDGPQRYSLREPVAIPPDAQDAAKRALESVVGVLNDAFRSETAIELTLDGMQQQTTGVALSILPSPVWVAGLARPTGGGLALALHPGVGLALVDLAMGGPGKIPENLREPTALEARVLRRLVGSSAERLGELLGETLNPVDCRFGEIPQSVATLGETVAVGLLRFHIGEGDHTSLLLATASLLLPSEQPTKTKGTSRPGPLAHALEQVVVSARPTLKAGSVTLGQLLTLRPGKVLQLDAVEDGLFELRIGQQSVAQGKILRKVEGAVFAIEHSRGETPRKESPPAQTPPGQQEDE